MGPQSYWIPKGPECLCYVTACHVKLCMDFIVKLSANSMIDLDF